MSAYAQAQERGLIDRHWPADHERSRAVACGRSCRDKGPGARAGLQARGARALKVFKEHWYKLEWKKWLNTYANTMKEK